MPWLLASSSPLSRGTTLLASQSHLLPIKSLSTSAEACWGGGRGWREKHVRASFVSTPHNKLDSSKQEVSVDKYYMCGHVLHMYEHNTSCTVHVYILAGFHTMYVGKGGYPHPPKLGKNIKITYNKYGNSI